jgi:hypothetical protein
MADVAAPLDWKAAQQAAYVLLMGISGSHASKKEQQS